MKKSICVLLSMLLLTVLFSSAVDAQEEPVQAVELTQQDYESADLIFDQIETMEAQPAKRGSTQSQLSKAAEQIVVGSDSYVEGSLERNGDVFTWFTDSGIRCIYNPHMRQIQQNMVAPECPLPDGAYNEPKATKGGYPTSKQVYLIAPYYGYDSSFTGQYKTEAKDIAKAIGDTDGYTLYSGTKATIDKIATAIENGAVVIFDSHGSTDYVNPNKSSDLVTGATTSYLCLKTKSGLTSYDYSDCGASYSGSDVFVNGYSIAYHMDQNSPGGMLWMGMCYGMALDSFSTPLREKGVEVLYGYSQAVTFGGDYLFAEVFWDNFCASNSVAASIYAMKAKYGQWDRSQQICKYYDWSGYCPTEQYARNQYAAFPIVVSDEDPHPGQRKSSSVPGADKVQTVKSTYTLFDGDIHGTCGDDLSWSLSDDGVLTISGTGPMTEWTYESQTPWVYYKTMITAVIIEKGATSIGSHAFHNFDSMTTITIPDGILTIGKEALRSCDVLTELKIPDSVTTLGSYVAAECNAVRILEVGGGVTSMGDHAFYQMRTVEQVILHEGITHIGEYSISGCYALESLVVPDSVTSMNRWSLAFNSALRDARLPAGLTQIPAHLFQSCTSLEAVNIPETVTSIGDGAFGGCNLKTLELPEGVSVIGNDVFNGNCFTSITIPDTVTSIGERAFCGCSYLEQIYVSDSVESIGKEAFSYCSVLKDVRLSNSITELPDYLFSSCTGLESFTIPEGVTTLGRSVFYGCTALEEMTVGGNVTGIGSSVFLQCTGLRAITFTGNVQTVGSYALDGCTALEEVTLGDSVISLGNYAFTGCQNIKTVHIGKGLATLGDNVFNGCVNIEHFYVDAENPVFSVSADEKLLIMNGTDIVKSVHEVSGSYEIPVGIEVIGKNAFEERSGLIAVVFNGELKQIQAGAFKNCTGLVALMIPDNVELIGLGAFQGCYNLEHMTIPFVGEGRRTAEDAYQYPFGYIFGSVKYENSLLVSPSFKGSVNSRTNYYIPIKLETVVVTGGELLNGAFESCSNIKKLVLPEGMQYIGNSVTYCYGLTEITIPSTVTTLGNTAFYHSNNLKKVIFTGPAPTIGSRAFSRMNATAYYPAGNETWTEDVLKDYDGTITWVAVCGADGHTAVVDEAVAATCTSYGVTQGSHCSTCGAVLTVQLTVVPMGHSLEDDVCTSCGYSMYTASVGNAKYATVQEAVDHADGGVVKLLGDSVEEVTAQGDLYLDLNGHELAQLTVSGTLYGMDSFTADYDNLDEYGAVLSFTGTCAPYYGASSGYYISNSTDNALSFHLIRFGVTHMSLKPASSGFGFKARFLGNAVAAESVESYGLKIWITEDNKITATFTEFEGGSQGNVKSLRIENILSGTELDAQYAQTKVYASAFITVRDGDRTVTLETAPVSGSLAELINAVNRNVDGFSDTQLQQLRQMVNTYRDAIDKAGISVENILKTSN